MIMATRVRETRGGHEPMALPQSTIGAKAPTALAIAAVGKLRFIAAHMHRSKDSLFKWAEGERGPECELAALFPAMRAVGIPRDKAALVLARIHTLFVEAYTDDLPALAKLHEPETVADTAEDRMQMVVALAETTENKAQWQQHVLQQIAESLTVAARLERDLKEAGKR